jgi:hypothetical protein
MEPAPPLERAKDTLLDLLRSLPNDDWERVAPFVRYVATLAREETARSADHGPLEGRTFSVGEMLDIAMWHVEPRGDSIRAAAAIEAGTDAS